MVYSVYNTYNNNKNTMIGYDTEPQKVRGNVGKHPKTYTERYKMKVTLSLMPVRYSPVNYRLANPNYEFIGKVTYMNGEGALVYDIDAMDLKMVRRGFKPVCLPTGETLWHIAQGNTKRGASTINPSGPLAPYTPYTPPEVTVTSRAGRPAKHGKPMRNYLVGLPDDLAEGVRVLGDGNMAAGIRMCCTICVATTNVTTAPITADTAK